MANRITRRDLLKLAGGSALGFVLSPVPYKLLDDSSIWTQNWSWVPKPPRGPVTHIGSHCTLCPAGCPTTLRCVGGMPVSIAGRFPDGAVSGLCATGYGLHHLRYLPSRLSGPVILAHQDGAVTVSEVPRPTVVQAIATAIQSGRGRVAVLDRQPGRTVSIAYQTLISAIPGGIYLTGSFDDASFTAILERMGTRQDGAAYVDVDQVDAIVSFGAPILEGWGNPPAVMRRWNSTSRFRLSQIETRPSATAMLADRWVPIRPGTEAPLAIGLAHVLFAESLVDRRKVRRIANDLDEYEALAASWTPERTAAVTGIAEPAIRSLAREVARPALVIPGIDPAGGPLAPGEQIAVMALNILTGAAGSRAGFRIASPVPSPWTPGVHPTRLHTVQDHSISVLLLDDADGGDAIAWNAISRKLTSDALVVALSPYASGIARHARYILPTPPPLETVREIPDGTLLGGARFAIVNPVATTRMDVADPFSTVREIAAAAAIPHTGILACGSMNDVLGARMEHIHSLGKGELTHTPDRSLADVSAMGREDFCGALQSGAVWRDAVTLPCEGRYAMCGQSDDVGRALAEAGSSNRQAETLAAMPFGFRGTDGARAPLMSKVYQESGLRPGILTATLHPSTARAWGLNDGDTARITTRGGACVATIRGSRAVMPGVVHIAIPPHADVSAEREMDDLPLIPEAFVATTGDTWRMTYVLRMEALPA